MHHLVLRSCRWAAVLAAVAAGLAGPAAAIPKVVVPGQPGTLYAAPVDETMPLSDAVPTAGLVARSMGFGITGPTSARLRGDLYIAGYTARQDPIRGVVNEFQSPGQLLAKGRFAWELPVALLASQTQVVNGKPQPYSLGVSLQYRHHMAAADRVQGWAPLVAFGKLNQPWAYALLLRNGVPVLAHKQTNGTFFDLGAEAVGHQPTLRIDDGKWHHIVLNFWQPPNPAGCGGVANATCAGRGLLRLIVDGALMQEYQAELTNDIRLVTVGGLEVTAGQYNGQNNWQASPPMLLARGQIDDLALYRRALTSREISALERRGASGLVAVWPEPSAGEVGLSATSYPGAVGEGAVSPLTGFSAGTNPIFFADPASVGKATLERAFPPTWDLFAAPGFTAALTVQPNSQKWIYVRRTSNAWFGFAYKDNVVWAYCGSGVFGANADSPGKYQSAAAVALTLPQEWLALAVSQSATATRVVAQGYTAALACPTLPLLESTDYVRVAGEAAGSVAKVARAMLWRRPLALAELRAEAFPGPTVWTDPTQAQGQNAMSRINGGAMTPVWTGATVPANGVISKATSGASKTLVVGVASSVLDPALGGGEDRPFTLAMRFRIDKAEGPDADFVLARRGQVGGTSFDFELRARCSIATWDGCRLYLLSPGSAAGQPSGQWRVDVPIQWGKEHSVVIAWPANGIVEGPTPGTAIADQQPRVAVDGLLQNKVDGQTASHVADILPVWKMWGDHNRPTATGSWSWSFGGPITGNFAVALRDLRLYGYAVQAVDGVYARCATLGCAESGRKCVEPDAANAAASAICHGCDDLHTQVAGAGPTEVECRRKALFMEECNAGGDCLSGQCDSATRRCLATDAASTETACAEANEGTTLALGCPAGSVITAVTYASYGAPTGSCAGDVANGSCHATSSLQKVKEECEGKATCAIAANNATFGDPCSGSAKRLVVRVTCSSGKAGCDAYCGERGRTCDSVGGGAYRCGNCAGGYKRLPGYDKMPAHHPGLECTWAPTKQQGELCSSGAECISAVCGNSTAEPVPFKIHTHYTFWNGHGWDNLRDYDGHEVQKSRPTHIKRCMGETGQHCSKVRFTPRPVATQNPDCKAVTAFDCNEQCDSPSRELRWTILAPETCKDIHRYSVSKWPGTATAAYLYAVGGDGFNSVVEAYQGEALTLQQLKTVVLRDISPYNPNTDYARLITAGVGRILIEYARTSNNSAERAKMIAKYGNFGALNTCDTNSAYNGGHNRIACEPKLQPIGALCPPAGEPEQEKHDFCVTNYCARDTRTCQVGDHPLLEPRPSAGNQDRQGKRDVKFGLVRLIDTTIEAEKTDKAVSNQDSKYRYVADLTNAYCMRMFGAYVPPFPLLMSTFHLDRTKDEACASYQFKAYVANKALSHGEPKPLLGSCTGMQITDNTVCTQGECEFGPLITGNLSELADAILGSFNMTVGGAAPGCLPLEGTPVGELIDKLTILKTQTVGPIPLAVQFGPTLDICIDPLVNMSSNGLPKITVRPSVGLGVDARGGIGIAEGQGKSKAIKFWAGVQLLLDVVKLGFPVGWGVDVKDVPVTDGSQPPILWNLEISQRIGIDLEMFSGSFGIFAEIALGPFTIGFSIKLFAWTGLLFEWELSNVPLWSTKLDFGKPKVIGVDSIPDHDHSGWFSGQTCNGLCK